MNSTCQGLVRAAAAAPCISAVAIQLARARAPKFLTAGVQHNFIRTPLKCDDISTHFPAVCARRSVKGKKVKFEKFDIAPLTVLDSGALQPRKWQLIGTGCSSAVSLKVC